MRRAVIVGALGLVAGIVFVAGIARRPPPASEEPRVWTDSEGRPGRPQEPDPGTVAEAGRLVAASRSPVPRPGAETGSPLLAEVGGSLRGRVVDSSEQPVVGAEVALLTSEGHLRGRTESDENGRFHLRLSAEEEGWVAAARSGFATAIGRDPRLPGRESRGEIVLTLGAEATIRGRVRTPGGDVPRERVRVAAWRAIDRMPEKQALDIARSSPSLYRVTDVDQAGGFELRGLRPDERYLLSAGGAGYAPAAFRGPPGPTAAIAGGPEVELFVAPLYVLDVEFLSAEGGALAVSSQFYGYPAFRWDVPKGLQGVSVLLPGVQMSDLDFPGPERIRSGTTVHSIWTGSEEAERLGPIAISASAPGYLPVEAGVWAFRARPGITNRQRVLLAPSGTGFGAVRLVVGADFPFVPYDIVGGGSRPREPFVRVRLRPDGWQLPGVRFLEIPLGAPAFDSARIEGIPEGRYLVSLEAPMLAAPTGDGPGSVRIQPGEVAEVALPTGPWGACEVSAFERTAEGPVERRGPLLVDVRRQVSGGMKTYAFDHSPYRILGLAPGAYTFRASHLGYRSGSVEVFVDSGQVRTIPLELVPSAGRG